MATWVRGLGVNDPELSPNHAWRHTFKAIGFRSGMSEKVLDAIVGHAPASVGRSYGEPTLADKTKELPQIPALQSGCRCLGSKSNTFVIRLRPSQPGLSHLNICELEQYLGEEGIVPPSVLELSAHGAL